MGVDTQETVRGDSIIRDIDGKGLAYARQVYAQLHPQWDNSWTVNSTYTKVTGSYIKIDFDKWPNHNWYLQVIGKTDAGTGFYQLYNTTDSAYVTDSEISTTSAVAVAVKSNALPRLTGIKEFELYHKIVGGNETNEFVNSIMSDILWEADF